MNPTPALPNLASAAFKSAPHALYARLRAEAPVVRTTLPDRKPAWLITRYADVAAALKDPRLAKNPYRALTREQRARQVMWIPPFIRPLASTMLDQDPPDHGRLRGLVHQAFTPKRIEDLRGRIQAICDRRLAAARASGAFDLVEALAFPLPMQVIADMLGVPEGRERDRFRALTNRLVTLATPGDMLFAMPWLWALVRYLRSLVRARRRDPGRDDLLAALVHAEAEGDRLTEDELLSMVALLLIAGHETTVNLIAVGTLALLDHPEALARLRAEPSLVKPAVEELLRFTSPVDIATERYSAEELTVAGVTIPKGERVFAVIGSANRDPSVFADPDALVLDREPNRHVAFGNGPHYCLGGPLARLEAQVAFETLLRELPAFELAIPRASVRWKPSLNLRGVVSLPLRVTSHRAAAA